MVGERVQAVHVWDGATPRGQVVNARGGVDDRGVRQRRGYQRCRLQTP